MPQNNAIMIVSCFLVGCSALNSAFADPSATQPAAEPWPQKFTATIGDVRVRVDGPKRWTLSGIEYKDTVMAVEDSAYGTVVTFPGAPHQHLGTAHFLDIPGKPGEIEKEGVSALRYIVDGKPIENLAEDMKITGNSLRVERVSKIRDLDVVSMFEVRNNVLFQTVHLHATRPVDLAMSYPLMFAWSPKTREFLFVQDDGTEKAGAFVADDAKALDGREVARYMAVFDPSSGKGSIGRLVESPPDYEVFFQYTDAPNIYHKLRLLSFIQKTIPQGFNGRFTMIVGFFESDSENWKIAARKRAAELKDLASGFELP